MKITIVGAGIAGISAALALRGRGHQIALWERSPTISPVGAGILLTANALSILSDLGVDLAPCGEPVHRFTLRNAYGAILQTTEMARILPGVSPPLAFDRRELHEALVAALPADIAIQFGRRYDANLLFDRDLLIGADGIRSAVREAALGPIELSYSGTTCWRALVENPGVREGFEAWGGAARLGMVPLTRNRLYVFLVLTAPRGIPRQTSIVAIRSRFEHFAAPVPAVLEALEGVELLHHDLEELPAVVWGRERTLLIGDAAHAMTPNLGQGAGMCIEDAAVLSDAVSSSSPVAAMHALRHKRVSGIHLGSRRFGQLAHWQSPAAQWLRNTLVRLTPQSFADSSYRRIIAPGLSLAGTKAEI